MQESPSVWEIKTSLLSHNALEQVKTIRFSPSEELLWSGTDRGYLHANGVPDLDRYCSFRAHQQQLSELVPLPPSIGNGVLSLSADAVHYHANGGSQRFAYTEDASKDMTSCVVDMQFPQTAVIGRLSGQLSTLDLQTGKLSSTVEAVTEGVALMRTQATRGLMAVAGLKGEVVLVDPRRKYTVEQRIKAHNGSVVAMDVSGSMLATAGLGTRQGQLVQDTIVKVYDVRSTPRIMSTVPFSAGPSLLRFHPRLQGVLLVAAASGQFVMDHVQRASYATPMQVETEGDLLTSVDFSTSGECLAFSGSGGFVHLWGFSSAPRANLRSTPLDRPPLQPQPETTLEEDQPFSIAAARYYTEESLVSDWDERLLGRAGMPPRVVDPKLLQNIKQVDFVTYIPNPHYQRERAAGEAAKKVALLRNKRMQPKELGHARGLFLNTAASHSSILPQKYRKIHITLDTDKRYEEFDFSRFNKTRFAGLENGIANCYANALVQVLYFIPRLRSCFLNVSPDASLEFSLLDELALCFRMLASEAGHACQATNFLRALRQSREATGLGLLEGNRQQSSSRSADIEVEANKDQSLARRVQRLQRFLLDKVHHELLQRQNSEQQPAQETSKPAEEQEEVERGSKDGSTAQRKSAVQEVFGMMMKQTMQGLQGSKPSLNKDIQCFQVDLQYPRASKTAAAPPTSKGSSPQAGAKDKPNPTFSEVLAASLRAEGETRAWFDEQLKYQYVRQTRVPLMFPEVLTIGTNLQDRSNQAFWTSSEGHNDKTGLTEPWAPVALALEIVEDGTRAVQSHSAQTLPAPSADCKARVEYELTAVVALVQEEIPSSPERQRREAETEGHLVAHVLVPPSYLDKEVGMLPTPRAKPPSPGYHASARNRASTFAPGPGVPEHPFEGLPDDPFGEIAAEQATEREGAAAEHGLPDDLFDDNDLSNAGFAEQNRLDESNGAQPLAEGQTLEGDGPSFSQSGFPGFEGSAQSLEDTMAAREGQGESAYPPADSALRGKAFEGVSGQFSRLKIVAERSNSFAQGEATAGTTTSEPVWLLINDFSISQTPRAEALQMFQGHKLPCLLYYTQVSATQWGSRQDFKVLPKRVLSTKDQQAFHNLCRQPPLQASLVGLHRLKKAAFVPLSREEGPNPGLILGLDAEFVAFSPPSKTIRGGMEVEMAPSRLGLARVSLVRGEGPQAGKACIDDFIRATEPVYDYLTQYSGLRAGDLDPALSQHYLTTLKASYLKLRYLVDAGCIFVGHGLKKDFRMINMLVPTEQVVDTVDLFYLKRHRKVSLKFLAAYLLQEEIQQTTHDSVEDACTALSLYKLYARLQREGRVREVVEDMYAWGKQHLWNPAALRDNPVAPL